MNPMSLRERIEEFKSVISKHVTNILIEDGPQRYHDLIDQLIGENKSCIYYAYWVLWEMHDAKEINISEECYVTIPDLHGRLVHK